MEISDNQIVEQVIEGDGEAYAKLVQRYQKIIYNLMFRFSLCTEDATELTQDVFCIAFEKLGTFKRDKTFFPWLYTLAMNRGRDWRRKNTKDKQGLKRYSAEIFSQKKYAENNKVEQQQEFDKLFHALSKLPTDTREMVLLRYKNEIPISELSETFKLSKSGVKMRIHRALQSLQDTLDNG